MQEQINYLQKQIDDLKEWQAQKKRQQITFPLDKISTDVLNSTLSQAIAVNGVYVSTVNIDPYIALGYGTWTLVSSVTFYFWQRTA